VPVTPDVEAATSTPSYDERLSVPLRWWPVVLAIVALGVLEMASGFTYVVYIPVTVFLFGFFVVPLLLAGRLRVRLRDGVLSAGGAELPVMNITSVQALDRAATRLKLGPEADPACHQVVRGWIATSVVLRLSNPKPTPYWVVSTRHPEELADAIKSARAHVRASR
jgi:hypothetical protein